MNQVEDKTSYQKKYQALYRLKNKEKRALYDKNRTDVKSKNEKYSIKNKNKILEQKKDYYNKNKEFIKIKQKEYRTKNPHVHIEKGAKRRSIRKNQTPVDSNRNFIKQFYITRKRISDCIGIKFHVDHIFPLSCGGLHHENNLRVIPAKINLRKGTRIE